jgi:hypothetical protein
MVSSSRVLVTKALFHARIGLRLETVQPLVPRVLRGTPRSRRLQGKKKNLGSSDIFWQGHAGDMQAQGAGSS